jgi:hypothetical protein
VRDRAGVPPAAKAFDESRSSARDHALSHGAHQLIRDARDTGHLIDHVDSLEQRFAVLWAQAEERLV